MGGCQLKPLPSSYRKHGFHFEVLQRRGDYVIAQQRLRPGVGCLAFEVFRVRRHKEAKVFGKIVEAHEAPPSTEDWGRHGWTFPTLKVARAKVAALLARDEAAVRAIPSEQSQNPV